MMARVILKGEGKNIVVERILYTAPVRPEKKERVKVIIKGVGPRVLNLYWRGNEAYVKLEEVMGI